MIVTLWVLITIIFFLFRIMPVDPTALFIGASLHPDSQKMMMEQFGLDQPKLKQYFIYMKNLFKGEFGISIRTNQQVLKMLHGKLWNTLFMMGAAMGLAMILGVVIGTILAWKRGTGIDTGGIAIFSCLTLGTRVLAGDDYFAHLRLHITMVSHRSDADTGAGVCRIFR